MDQNRVPTFTTALWGFNRGEVRRYVDGLRSDLSEARERLAALRYEVESSVARAAMEASPQGATGPVVLSWPLETGSDSPTESQVAALIGTDTRAGDTAANDEDFTADLGDEPSIRRSPDDVGSSGSGASAENDTGETQTAPIESDDFVPLAQATALNGSTSPKSTGYRSSAPASMASERSTVGSNIGQAINADIVTESDALAERLTPSVDRVLAECAASARSIEDRAHERTEALIEAARERAQLVLDDARNEREAMLERTHAECAELIDAMHTALAEAEQTRSEAVKASERAAWAATDKLRAERSGLEREIIELTTQRDALTAQLTGVRSSLQRIMDNVPDWAQGDIRAAAPAGADRTVPSDDRDARASAVGSDDTRFQDHPAGPELSVDLRAPANPSELDLRISPETSPPAASNKR